MAILAWRWVNGIVIEPERCSAADADDEVVRRAFRHYRGVAGMVAVIGAWPGYRIGLAFVARPGARVVGVVMVSGTDLVGEAGCSA